MFFSKKKALFSNFFLALLFLSVGCSDLSNVQPKTIFAMDTAFSIRIVGESPAKLTQCENAVSECITALSDSLDCHAENSLISQLNASKSCEDAQGQLSEILLQTLALEKIYGNAVQLSCRPLTKLWNIGKNNTRIPSQAEIDRAAESIDDTKISVSNRYVSIAKDMELDLGAVAKGFALDEIVCILQKNSLSYAVVDAASAVLLYGQKPDDSPFRVSISDPNGNGLVGTLFLQNAFAQDAVFVSTSGDAERFFMIEGKKYSHIIDLHTGCPAESNLSSVTVVAKNGLLADYLSTLIYLGGTENLSSYLQADDFQVLALDKDGHIYRSENISFEVNE